MGLESRLNLETPKRSEIQLQPQSFFTSLLGKPIRKISSVNQLQLFLTFDDGPDPYSTGPILNLLEKHQVPATFFMIAEKAVKNRDLTKRIVSQGHTIGNHSLDHCY